jgi:hypothetical protein
MKAILIFGLRAVERLKMIVAGTTCGKSVVKSRFNHRKSANRQLLPMDTLEAVHKVGDCAI